MSSNEALDPRVARLRDLESVFRGPQENFGPYEIEGVGRVEVRFGVPPADTAVTMEQFDFSVIKIIRPGIEEVLTYKVFSDGRIERFLDLDFEPGIAFPEEAEMAAFDARKAEIDAGNAEHDFDVLFTQIQNASR